MNKKHLRFILINLLIVGIPLLLAEAALEYLMNNPDKIPDNTLSEFRAYYMKKDRRIAQYHGNIAHYDSRLFYSLSYGNHAFNNREFKSTISVNSQGFRDLEDSEINPQVIFLGDSYTMGWGVNFQDCFTTIVRDNTSLKTLNTGVSSYGTVREMKVLNQLSTDSLEVLFIQYAFNDYGENTDYFFNNNKYKVSSESKFLHAVKQNETATRYFPLKHLSHFVRKWFDDKFPKPPTPQIEESETKYVDQWKAFVNVVREMSIPETTKIVVFQVDNNDHQEVFLNPLRQSLLNNDSLIANEVFVLDLQQQLKQDHYFLLDGHLNAEGNKLVANELIKLLSQ